MPKIWTPGQGPRLKQFREAAGLTQEVVAEKLGVSWMTVHRCELPDTHKHLRTVPIELIEQYCELYGVTMAQMVPGCSVAEVA